jgi:hypothetical protein
MATHRFKVGQKVSLIPGHRRMSSSGDYKIIQLLPPAEGQFQYRVKGTAEVFERVVKESDLELRS